MAVHITMDECTLAFIARRNGNVQRQVSWRTCCDGLDIFNPQFLPGELQERLLQQAMAAQTTITSVHTHYSLTLSCKITYEKHNVSLQPSPAVRTLTLTYNPQTMVTQVWGPRNTRRWRRREKSVHESSVEITNKMQPCNRIYYSNVY